MTRLNQEGARLVADLSHAQKALYEQQSRGRQLEQKLEDLRPIKQHCNMVEIQLIEKDTHIKELKQGGRRVEAGSGALSTGPST